MNKKTSSKKEKPKNVYTYTGENDCVILGRLVKKGDTIKTEKVINNPLFEKSK